MNAILKLTGSICGTLACFMLAASVAFSQPPPGEETVNLFDCNVRCQCNNPTQDKCLHPDNTSSMCNTSICECNSMTICDQK